MKSWSTGHGPGFCFIDSYKTVDKNSGIGVKTFKKDAEFFKHHFPSKPIVPAVYIIESAAQAAGILWGKQSKNIFSKKVYGIAGIEKFNFYRFVLPEQILSIEVECLTSIQKLGRFKIKCTVDNELIAQGIILMAKIDNLL
jgi:3-hydroxyacyl-[acyl-carrier-protein] dehydratase